MSLAPGELQGTPARNTPAELVLTFSLETWWEKGQVPSVFLQVPRTNLCRR